MVKSINIIRRIGSKQNDIKYFSNLLPLDVETVVEPFGGSFAVSKFFYKDINKYKFHINDLDESLFYIYTHYQEYLQHLTTINDLYDTLDCEYKGKQLKVCIDELNINYNFKRYIINNFIIRGVMFKPLNNKNFDENEKQILNNSLFTNEDYMNIFNKYKDDDKAFLFLDPPYLFSDNSNYIPQNVDNDMTMILVDILNFIETCKCKVMLVINKLNIIEYVFKNYIKGEYFKTYQLSKNKMKHLMITNYNQ